MKVLVIPPRGEIHVRDITGLKPLQEAVSGYLEELPFGPTGEHLRCLVDEDAKSKTWLDRNYRATYLVQEWKPIGMQPMDFILGTMLVMGPTVDSNYTDLPQSVIDEITRVLSEKFS